MVSTTDNEVRPSATSLRPGERAEEVLTPERVFTDYAPWVYHLARRLLGNEADAADVTGQVFLQVVRKLPTFRGESSFPTWLRRVAVNAALAFRRARTARRGHEAPGPVEEFTTDGRHAAPVRRWDPVALAIERETHELVESALARLPDSYREVCVLADVEGRSTPEIAELLGLSVPAVKSRLHRARVQVRKDLAPYFEESAA